METITVQSIGYIYFTTHVIHMRMCNVGALLVLLFIVNIRQEKHGLVKT